MLLIFNTLQIFNLGDMITKINIIKAIIFLITIITIIIVVNHGKENIIFITNKIVDLISI